MIWIIEILLTHLIEPFMMVGAGLGIIGLRIYIRKMILISVVSGFLIFGVRKIYAIYEIPLGTHTFILSLCFVLLLRFIGKQRVLDSIIAVLISIFLLLVGEGIVFMPIVKFLDLDVMKLIDKPGMTLIFQSLSYIPILLTFIVGYVFNISIIDIASLNKTIEL